LAGNALKFMEGVMDNLPNHNNVSRWSMRKVRGLLHAVAAFDCYRRQEYRKIAKHTFLAYYFDWGWLRNRGLFKLNVYSQWKLCSNFLTNTTSLK
jgi:hypothetical protein